MVKSGSGILLLVAVLEADFSRAVRAAPGLRDSRNGFGRCSREKDRKWDNQNISPLFSPHNSRQWPGFELVSTLSFATQRLFVVDVTGLSDHQRPVEPRFPRPRRQADRFARTNIQTQWCVNRNVAF